MELQFLDETTFRGTMFWDGAGTFGIAGKIDWERTRNRVFMKNIRGWKDRYRELNAANYNVESITRWSSGWARPARPDPAADSDTTIDGPSDQEDDETTDGM
jgi:hypothetical protein